MRGSHRWWLKGQLGDRGSLPAALVDGLEAYDGALNALHAHDWDEDAKRREREAEAGAQAPTWGPAAMQRPVHRRR